MVNTTLAEKYWHMAIKRFQDLFITLLIRVYPVFCSK